MSTHHQPAIDTFFQQQLGNWVMAREHYNDLRQVRQKSFAFDGYNIEAQYNPRRMISSSARVDEKSIRERPCFLCRQNRPAEQLELPFEEDYLILLNPYPVFEKHFTIPSVGHQPQEIRERFGVMLNLAAYMQDFALIYNGPRCGASAPDHFHFQAVEKKELPMVRDFNAMRNTRLLAVARGVKVFGWNDYLRYPVTFTGANRNDLERFFDRLYLVLQREMNTLEEPMMNVLTCHTGEDWVVHVFLREKHRPSQYFESAGKQILLSPASIDMSGVLIMPRENDFNKITINDIKDIYSQVVADSDRVNRIISQLINQDL
ncbi:MAG: DUF4922 domain-containing protein [Bacteroidales bacterium]